MKLYLMRHGIAAPIGGKIKHDAERPLTPEGQIKTRQAIAGVLRCKIELGVIATSPLPRARQTAEIVLQLHETAKMVPKMEVWPELEYAEYSSLLHRLQQVSAGNTMLVGHEPGLSCFAAQLLTGSPTGLNLEFKKAAICAIELEIARSSVAATLLWHAMPRQLRLMSE